MVHRDNDQSAYTILMIMPTIKQVTKFNGNMLRINSKLTHVRFHIFSFEISYLRHTTLFKK